MDLKTQFSDYTESDWDGTVHTEEMPLCVYVFYSWAVSLTLLGCSLLMGSLFSSSIQCIWTNLWRYSSHDAYDYGYDDNGSFMVDNMSTILFCVHVDLAV